MSNVKIKANASGSADFTIEAPATDSALTLTLPSVDGEVLVNSTTSNVGIGTSNPSEKLNVVGNIRAEASSVPKLQLKRTGATAGNGYIECLGSDDSVDYKIAFAQSANVMSFDVAGSTVMSIDNNNQLKFNSGYGSAATAYGCRAWVNFNATGTPSIRGSGNVSSITDSSPDFIVNFTTAMTDTNYSAIGLSQGDVSDDDGAFTAVHDYTTSSVKFRSRNAPTHSAFDSPTVNVAIFR